MGIAKVTNKAAMTSVEASGSINGVLGLGLN